MQVFLNQPRQQMCASLILLFGKQKLCLERMLQGKKPAFLNMLFVENERETREQKQGDMFFDEVEGRMQKLSSFVRVKRNTA